MQELEKILKEIKEVLEENKVIELNGDCTVDRCIIDVALAWDSIKAIIHNHMNDGWIPVGERLPEDDRMVLVTCQTKKGIRSVNRAYCDGAFWHGSGSMSGVIAWRPLPEPYRPERSEK